MDFSLNEVQSMLTDSIEKFLDNDYDFETRQQYAASELGYSPDVWQMFAELGWTAVPFSEADGGFDGGPIDTMLMMQLFGRGLVVEPYLANIILTGGVLRRAASEPQKGRWLQPIIAGELQAALAFAEPQSRYEIANVATSASQDGGEWVLNGSKAVVPNGGHAGLLVIPARTGGDNPSPKGITLFAVGGKVEGVQRRPYPTVDGHTAAEITLEDVRVPTDAVLGDIDDGFGTLEAAVDEATLAVCAEALGIMQAMTDKTVEYSKSRVQFGVPIGSFQAVKHHLANAGLGVEFAEPLVRNAAHRLALGSVEAERSVAVSMAKQRASLAAVAASAQPIGRLGAIVHAYDVRPVVREQVESLGGKFVELELSTDTAEDAGGYAKELGEDFYTKQREMMLSVVADSDVVITTAAIPGKPAPKLVTEDMVGHKLGEFSPTRTYYGHAGDKKSRLKR